MSNDVYGSLDDRDRAEMRRLGFSEDAIKSFEIEMAEVPAEELLKSYMAAHGITMTPEELFQRLNDGLICEAIEQATGEALDD
jgi:hypothetical protein